MNLNDLRIENDGNFKEETKDNSREILGGLATVYFRDLEARLIDQIRKARAVVGCVAWLTNETILRELTRVPGGVSIVVQKEDFLRPDIGGRSGWKDRLRSLYMHLKHPPERHEFGGLVGSLSVCGDPAVGPVRCVGNHNKDKSPAHPRMHNEFMVFCDTEEAEGEDPRTFLKPRSVWTGSFNLTKNATLSLENAILIKEEEAAGAYYREWEQILALSEPLDWTEDWCAPEWRVGT